MTEDSRERLKAFVKFAEKLKEATYTQRLVAQGGLSVKLSWKKGTQNSPNESSIEHNLPKGDSVIAIAVQVRQFIQKNDYVSLREMKILLDDPEISGEWKSRFSYIQASMTKYLAMDCGINEQWADLTKDPEHRQVLREESYSNRDVFDMFLNGGMAHSNPIQRATVERWQSQGFAAILWERSFHTVIKELCSGISYLYLYTTMELAGEPIPPIQAEF